ncbi:TIGR03503 family protein [Salinimonas marina]|uniref:TIGR03503 family protein n=1 Tax=Salinimonas marina TaxID=2785918 RepID=UPI001E37E8E3|nr:TIGR03503 family protein [Salinimonas marina]
MASKPKRIIRQLSLVLLAGWSIAASALQQQEDTVSMASVEPRQVIRELGDDYQNSITLLQNRFRVDHNVSEVTMVFFREYGSAPVVLVRPDGSKIFQSRASDENAKWFDADSYDMVTIKEPVPGPWQAVGQIHPQSRVMVVSEIELQAPSLPSMLFSGEILKQTATLTNGGKPIKEPGFREVVELQIELISTNNPNYDNFKSDKQVIATFADNGRGMDEKPGDGIFTGQFNLVIPAGEWTPVFSVTTPMFTREQVDRPFILHNNPINLRTTLAADKPDDAGHHTLHIEVDRDKVDINSLLIDGKVRYPNGDMHNFSLTEPTDAARTYEMVAMEEGRFTVRLTAYGKTRQGRDFILNVPEYSFVVEAEPPPPQAAAADIAVEEPVAVSEEEPSVPTPAGHNTDTAIDDNSLVLILVAVNGTILLVVGSVVGFVLWRRKKASVTADELDLNLDNPSAATPNPTPGIKDKILSLLGKKSKAESTNS